jgi:hypothetical protein
MTETGPIHIGFAMMVGMVRPERFERPTLRFVV